ncbi:MAG: hypothetical protein BGP22_20080 [Variovorax sp. 67-131]|nr:MAG: hypothetical protein ABS94_09970 [Variovorax sp. SCN 67-85]ODV18646.1 MAG: hypothetical protein ABT25_27680 [Variovorax sp. SCN 67-20]OJZ02709.1 MAG: hypothetical protein BGP22_20080 [Variovorax sp. 67-131]
MERVFSIREVKPNANAGQDYDKLFAVANLWGIRSVEAWYPSTQAPYLKVTHGPAIPSRCKDQLTGLTSKFEQRGAKVIIKSSYVSIHADLGEVLTELVRVLSGQAEPETVKTPDGNDEVDPALALPPISAAVCSGLLDRGAPTISQPPIKIDSTETRALLRSLVEAPALFAGRSENVQLLPGTLSYSTPFRGTAFGCSTLDEVAAALERRRLDVLILGSNPNAGELVAGSPYGTLEEQLRSGYFGEAYFGADRTARAGWTPQSDSKPGWRSLFRAIQKAGFSSDAVAMVNYLPWGSSKLAELVQALDSALLERAIEFADEQLSRLLTLFRPKVVIVVRSLTETKGFHSPLLADWRQNSSQASIDVATMAGGTKPVNFLVSGLRNAPPQLLLHMPHPGYLRISNAGAPAFEEAVARLMTPPELSIKPDQTPAPN